MSRAPVLVGRDVELDRLRALLVGIVEGDGRVVLVHGEAGAGKTALVRAATAGLPADIVVAVGGCDPLSTPRPLGPVHDVAAVLGPEVTRSLEAHAPPHEIFAAVHDRLRARPHVLVVEDAHWADEGTLDLLRYLGRRIAGTSAALVVTYRDSEFDDRHPLRVVLGDLARSGGIARIGLGPLPLDAVETMVAGTGLRAAAVHELTGGNAFFVTEVVAQPDRAVPDSVRDAVLARTTQLDDAALAALRMIACIPGGVAPDGISSLQLASGTVGQLTSSGLLAVHGERVCFAHELGRLTIYEAIRPSELTALHREVLDALDGTADGDFALLAHLARRADRPDSVVRFARQAAAEATAVGAHSDAAAFLESALDACQDPHERVELLEALSHEHYLVDRIGDAIAALEDALHLRRTRQEWPAIGTDLRRLSRLHWLAGDRDIAEREASEAVDVLARTDDEPELGFAYGQQATLAMVRWDPSATQAWGGRAMEIAERCQLPELRVQMLNTMGTADLMAGDDGGATKLRESATIATALGLDEHTARALVNLAFYLVEAGRYDEATAVLEEGIGFTADRELDTWHRYFLGIRARMRLDRGHWTAAWDDATEVLSNRESPLHAMWPLLVRGLLRLRRGDPDPREPLEEAWHLAVGFRELYRMVPIAAALAEHEWLTDEPGDAAERLTRLAGMVSASAPVWLSGQIATWLRRLGAAVPHGIEAPTASASLDAPYDRALELIDAGDSGSLLEALDVVEHLGASTTARFVRRRLRRLGITPPAGPRPSTRTNPAGLTARQVDVLQLVAHGCTNAEIARRLYISEKTAGHHVSAILMKLGVANRHRAGFIAKEIGLVH